MKVLNLSKKRLTNIVATGEIVGRGSYGILYKLDEHTLFKFNYKDFINCFEASNNEIDLKKLGDISDKLNILKRYEHCHNGRFINEKMVKLLIRKDAVKLTDLTQGAVFVDNYCVGYLLKYHKNMVNLYDYWNKTRIRKKDRQAIYTNLEKAVEELIKNNIFMSDLTMNNIMINPQTNEVQIIDFEDCNTDVKTDTTKFITKFLTKKMYNQLHEIGGLLYDNKKLDEEEYL